MFKTSLNIVLFKLTLCFHMCWSHCVIVDGAQLNANSLRLCALQSYPEADGLHAGPPWHVLGA